MTPPDETQDVHPPLPASAAGVEERAPVLVPPIPDPGALAGVPAVGGEGYTFDLIRSMESQFERVRGLAAEAAQRAAQLEARAHDLEALGATLAAREAALQAHATPALDPAPIEPPADLRAELDAVRAQLAERESAIEVLAVRLREAECDPCNASGPEPCASDLDGAGLSGQNTLRRQRLARYKHLLNQQSRKLLAAKNALAKRQAECDQVIAHRAKLAQLAGALSAREQEVELRAAKGTGAVFAAAACVIAGIVAGLSWTVAGIVAPATYAARATLVAKDAQAASPDELAAWTQAHKSLAKDPTAYAEAAENFQRRGIEALASPAGVQERFSTDLYVQSDTPGSITLELRGPGRERTTRELETFISAVLARSEAGRGMRADALAPAVALQPAAGDEPVSTERLVYAAVLSGGGIVLACGAGVVGYAILARSKKRFDQAVADVAIG
ncbi:MAG: hypothetical protein ACKVS8_03495 [Phycisphaerales bacterium]